METIDQVFAKYSAPDDDMEFDSDLWAVFLDVLNTDYDNVKLMPSELQSYYATRTLEWEVGNGGIDQYLDNLAHCADSNNEVLDTLDMCIRGYQAFNAPVHLDLVTKLKGFVEQVIAKGGGDHKVHDILEAMPEDELDAEIEKLEAITDTDEFSGGQDEARLNFVFAHKEVFIEYVR